MSMRAMKEMVAVLKRRRFYVSKKNLDGNGAARKPESVSRALADGSMDQPGYASLIFPYLTPAYWHWH